MGPPRKKEEGRRKKEEVENQTSEFSIQAAFLADC
jgi:hypothetical protein